MKKFQTIQSSMGPIYEISHAVSDQSGHQFETNGLVDNTAFFYLYMDRWDGFWRKSRVTLLWSTVISQVLKKLC